MSVFYTVCLVSLSLHIITTKIYMKTFSKQAKLLKCLFQASGPKVQNDPHVIESIDNFYWSAVVAHILICWIYIPIMIYEEGFGIFEDSHPEDIDETTREMFDDFLRKAGIR